MCAASGGDRRGIIGVPNEQRRRGRPRDPVLDGQILDAARAVLLEQGIRAFSLLEVARRAGVPKTTVYRRWSSRKEMLAAALTHVMNEADALPDTGSLRGDLVASVKAQLDSLDREARALARLGLEAEDDDELRPIVREAFDRRRRTFYLMLQRAIGRGELRPDVDFDATLDLVFGAVLSRAVSQRGDLSGVAEAMVDGALRGLGGGRAK
jgi:AcrR family transcriptional regulator